MRIVAGMLIVMVMVGCVHRPTGKSVDSLPTVVWDRKAEAERYSLAQKEAILRKRLLAGFVLDSSVTVAKERVEGQPLVGHIEPTATWAAVCALAVGAGETGMTMALLESLRGLEACDAANGLDGFYSRMHRDEAGALVPLSQITRSNATSQVLQALWLAAVESDDPEVQTLARRQAERIVANYLENDYHLTNGHGKQIDYSDLKSPAGPTRLLDRLLLLEAGVALLPSDSVYQARLRADLEAVTARPPTMRLRFLHFRLLNFEIPTPSTDFLTYWKLYVLVRMTQKPLYIDALRRMSRQLEDRHNPFFAAVTLALLDGPYAAAGGDLSAGLRDFPMSLDGTIIDNRELGDVPHRWLPRLNKNKVRSYAAVPVPVYRRTLNWFEWKRDARRLDRVEADTQDAGRVTYGGLDYLMLYWLVRRHQLIGADE